MSLSFSPSINTHAYVSHVNATHTHTATLHYSLTLSLSLPQIEIIQFMDTVPDLPG